MQGLAASVVDHDGRPYRHQSRDNEDGEGEPERAVVYAINRANEQVACMAHRVQWVQGCERSRQGGQRPHGTGHKQTHGKESDVEQSTDDASEEDAEELEDGCACRIDDQQCEDGHDPTTRAPTQGGRHEGEQRSQTHVDTEHADPRAHHRANRARRLVAASNRVRQ